MKQLKQITDYIDNLFVPEYTYYKGWAQKLISSFKSLVNFNKVT